LQEYAVFGRLMFDNRGSQTNAPEIFPPHLPYRQLQEISNDFHLRPGHPDIPLPRPRAASAARLTLKVQASNIPGCTFRF
jgi:hypothetical protein